ncbi:hypothetical protein SAMN04487819_105178 [Actinopolyspora alba]|uniref:DNA-binding domain-containing protein n=1 Tax=Actinopolyspora alba TaxID=673379 RepID=A0A1I1WDL5_9ACTN|nr:DUF262 domain-containing protein [Actinopolyspora alba]SFD93172.1 hypothetical protein SAMN04487819_105178 [Actinopolyspora alba]
MEKKFTSDEIPLAQLLDQVRTGKVQLPDFQRGWVWDDGHIASLLASISTSYPIGAVMTLQTGNPDVRFRPRPLEGAKPDPSVEPEFLLLDGQQRMTSLYLALSSGGAVPTQDARGNNLRQRYYADINACLDPFKEREDAVFGVPEDGIVRTFRGEVLIDVSSRDAEVTSEMFPLDIVLDYSETMSWQLKYIQYGPGEHNARVERWKAFTENVINAFVHYQVPAIQLVRSTPKEAVCQVFEKVNTGGVTLTVFELLTATYAADDYHLREDWNGRANRFAKHPVLGLFQATDFLQTITLLSTYERRQRQLAVKPGDDKAPPVSCKRRDILRLELTEYRKWADTVSDALERVVSFLHGEHVFHARDLPYSTQLVPLTALFVLLGEDAEKHHNRQRLRQWYWCGVFGEMYGGSTETRFAYDLVDVAAWIADDGSEPRTVREAQFQAERLLTLRTRNSAAYKGLYALQMKRGARDFHTGDTINMQSYLSDSIDIRHLFPQRWCSANEISDSIANSIVNKTAIDARTNRRIGNSAPSRYLSRIESVHGIETGELDAILHSHDVDPITLRNDDFAGFFNHRFERLIKQIEESMGKPVNRSADRSESPFVDRDKEPEQLRSHVKSLIAAEESKVVEFKATARRNLHTGEKDPANEWKIVKSIAGFMNAHGGNLLVGVTDEGSVIGVDEDFQFVSGGDRDGWELWLTDLIASALGSTAAAEMTVKFCDIDDHVVSKIEVGPSAKPIFATPQKGEKKPCFFVRINNSTRELLGQEILDYQQRRWPS